MSAKCGECGGFCAAPQFATVTQEERALRISAILYGLPLLVMMISLLLVSGLQAQIPLWLEILTLINSASLGYGLSLFFLRRLSL